MLDIVKLDDEAFVTLGVEGGQVDELSGQVGQERQAEGRQRSHDVAGDANASRKKHAAACGVAIHTGQESHVESRKIMSSLQNNTVEEVLKLKIKGLASKSVRRTTWKFYLTWARRIVVVKALLALLWS
jgi:hypothetical protein